MTGFGRGEELYNGLNISVELKAVNHRYFEYNCRVQRAFLFLEEALKPVFASKISRGKIDVFVTVSATDVSDTKITLNHTYLKEYLNALYELRDSYGLKDDISVKSVASNHEVFLVERVEVDEEEFLKAVTVAANKAIDKFIEMRSIEGEKLHQDLCGKIEEIQKLVKVVEETSPNTVSAYKQRLYDKIKETLNDKDVDEQRLNTEVAIFADRVAVDEETVRLNSHINQFLQLIKEDEPVGRKLDFLVQEMNRETNTNVSISHDVKIAQVVVDIKSLIEKIREQIQNIE